MTDKTPSLVVEVVRTNSINADFIKLVSHLDEDLAKRDGSEHSFYAQFNTVESLKNVAIAYIQEKPVGCGAMKKQDDITMEIKRMYTLPEVRGHGIGSRVLSELENWARELGYIRCRLETGKRQPEAIRLYEKRGYKRIPNYGQYVDVKNSLCFQKSLTRK